MTAAVVGGWGQEERETREGLADWADGALPSLCNALPNPRARTEEKYKSAPHVQKLQTLQNSFTMIILQVLPNDNANLVNGTGGITDLTIRGILRIKNVSTKKYKNIHSAAVHSWATTTTSFYIDDAYNPSPGQIPKMEGIVDHISSSQTLVQPPTTETRYAADPKTVTATGFSRIPPIPPQGHLDLPFTFASVMAGGPKPPPPVVTLFDMAKTSYRIVAEVETPRAWQKDQFNKEVVLVPLAFPWLDPAHISLLLRPIPATLPGYVDGAPAGLSKHATSLPPDFPFNLTISFNTNMALLLPGSSIPYTFRATPRPNSSPCKPQPHLKSISIILSQDYTLKTDSNTTKFFDKFEPLILCRVVHKESTNGEFWAHQHGNLVVPAFGDPKLPVVSTRLSADEIFVVKHRLMIHIELVKGPSAWLVCPVSVGPIGEDCWERLNSDDLELVNSFRGHDGGGLGETLPQYSHEE